MPIPMPIATTPLPTTTPTYPPAPASVYPSMTNINASVGFQPLPNGGGEPRRSNSRASFSGRATEAPKPQDTIPELAKLTDQELEDLLNNDQKFEQFLQTMDKLRNTETIVKELREENERVAGALCAIFVIFVVVSFWFDLFFSSSSK